MNEIVLTLNRELPIGQAMELVGKVTGVTKHEGVIDTYSVTVEVGTKTGMERGALSVMDHFDSHGNMESRPEISN